MNILIAADYATPASGNFVASCVELGRTLRQQGDTLTLIFPESPHTHTRPRPWVSWLEREGFPVYLAARDMPDEQVIAFLQTVIAAHDIDILHLHFGMFHHAVLCNRDKLGVRILIHDHMDFAAGRSLAGQKLRCAAQSLRYRRKDISVVSVNPWKDAAYCFAKHRYIPNGLSLIRNIERSETREEVRTALGIRPDEKVCMFLGWDVHRKGLDIAVRAINELRKTEPDMLLGVVGMGDPPAQARLKYITDSTGIDPMSSWIRYFPSREDMFAYHRAVDVYLSASRSEAFSYGILEAISQNTPVVVSDIRGTSWCHDYSRVVVYPTEDHVACANAIRQALSMVDKASNADKFTADYGIDKWCRQMIDMYASL